MKFYAHTAEDSEGKPLPESSGKWQLLSMHLRNVADKAKDFAVPLGLGNEAELAAWLHDLGKYAKRFQSRLHDNSIHGINHWSVGAFQAWELGRVAAALAIEGHHTGIPALKVNCDRLECWQQRHQKLGSPSEAPGVNGFSETLPVLLERFAAENSVHIPATPREKAAGREFAAGMRIRFLFSCLVDADFLDTEQHFNPSQTAFRNSPLIQESEALRQLLNHLATKPAAGEVNQLRRRLLTDCLVAAEKPPGLFTLTAPTGSGKTLASLAFALKHIERHNECLPPGDTRRLRRVIVVIPYTSIIEQTATVYRNLFEERFGPNYVLEP